MKSTQNSQAVKGADFKIQVGKSCEINGGSQEMAAWLQLIKLIRFVDEIY